MNEKTQLQDIEFSTDILKTNSGILIYQYENNNKRYIHFYKEVLLNINDLYMNAKICSGEEYYNSEREINERDIRIIRSAIQFYIPNDITVKINNVRISQDPCDHYFKIHLERSYRFDFVTDLSIENLINSPEENISLHEIENNLIHYHNDLIDNINAEYLLNEAGNMFEYNKKESM